MFIHVTTFLFHILSLSLSLSLTFSQAPEVLQHTIYNSSVDFWSFGVVVFECITGKRPFLHGDQSPIGWYILKLYHNAQCCNYYYCIVGNFRGAQFLWTINTCFISGLNFADVHDHTHYTVVLISLAGLFFTVS